MSQVIVIRHPKERKSKCSLASLHNHHLITFYNAHKDFRFDATGYILLTLNTSPLTSQDSGHSFIILDSTCLLYTSDAADDMQCLVFSGFSRELH